eukprot:Skav200808  [mRNA]  locus=scaffold5143:71823:79166:- [translate_table: standard]
MLPNGIDPWLQQCLAAAATGSIRDSAAQRGGLWQLHGDARDAAQHLGPVPDGRRRALKRVVVPMGWLAPWRWIPRVLGTLSPSAVDGTDPVADIECQNADPDADVEEVRFQTVSFGMELPLKVGPGLTAQGELEDVLTPEDTFGPSWRLVEWWFIVVSRLLPGPAEPGKWLVAIVVSLTPTANNIMVQARSQVPR